MADIFESNIPSKNPRFKCSFLKFVLSRPVQEGRDSHAGHESPFELEERDGKYLLGTIKKANIGHKCDILGDSQAACYNLVATYP